MAVARGDEDARLGARPLRALEDADLVVAERHRLEIRVELVERLPERGVERADRAVPLRRRVLGDALHAQLDRRLRDRRRVAPLLDDDPPALEIEPRMMLLARLVHEK